MLTEKRILIIDDEERMADSLKSLFEAEGYLADVAYCGSEGLAKIQQSAYDVVITDIRMDDCDGYEVMRFVKENCEDTLVIAITGYVSTDSVIRAIRQSAFDYIPKPYEFDALRDSVERAFAQVEARRMRDDLISMLTHDIKAPLSTIIGYAQMSLEGEGGGLHSRTREFLELITISGQRILSLVENFLTTCRVAAGRLEIAQMPVDVAEVIADLRPICELEARKRGVEMTIRIEPGDTTVLGDGHLLFRALGNLFHNAIKYAGENGRVEAVLRLVERADESGPGRWTVFEISNTGPGIEPEARERIFGRFERLAQMSGAEGAGLGLYVVHCTVQAHRGKIEVESQPNELTVFRVYLPLAEQEKATLNAER
ncbi:response regulator [Candidatus Sumerlaeota bacterium]|nr:response regulator [Candidatus Sumerlaeota bacterium]